MTLLAALRAALREDLHDADAGAYRWTDADLDAAIARALAAYSLAWPNETTKILTASVDGQTDWPLAGADAIANLLAITAVEYPIDAEPRSTLPWLVLATTPNPTLRLLRGGGIPQGEQIKAYAETYHEVSAETSTLPPEHDHVVLTGAAAYALDQWATYAVNRVNASTWTVRHFADRAQAKLADFRRELAALKLRRAQLAPSWTTMEGYEL